MALTSLSIILTVFVLQLHYTGSISPVMSKSLYKFVTKTIANRIGMSDTVKLYEIKKKKITERKESKYPKTKKIIQIETSLADCQNNIHSIKDDLKSLNKNLKFSTSKRSIATLKSCKKNKLKEETNNSIKSKSFEIYIENENHLATQTPEIRIEQEKTRLDSIIPIYNESIINNSYLSNANKIKPLMNGSLNIINNEKLNGNFAIDECMKRIDIFSKNIQKFIDLNELQDIDNIKKLEWKLIAEIIDRFLFWMFLVITSISSIFLLIIIPLLKQ